MAEKKNVLKESIKKKGFWDYKELYDFCLDWLKAEGFRVKEDKYEEKISPLGKEIKIEWTAKKKITDYYLYTIELKWHILGMNDAEVEIDGKKRKINKGEVKLKLSADLEKDWENRWARKPSYKFFRGIYDKYIVRATNEQYEDRLEDLGKAYSDAIKKFLELEV